MNFKEIAENATMQSFLNCYLRETDNYIEVNNHHTAGAEKVIHCPLANQGVTLIIPVKYWSLTERHLFHFPIYYRIGGEDSAQPKALDYVTLTTLITKELLIEGGRQDAEDEMILRVILSCRNMKKYLQTRLQDSDSLGETEFNYVEAEQSLLFGHLLHPTPKSKQGILEEEDDRYAPEMKGEFQLHYFRVKQSHVRQDSALKMSAKDLIIQELRKDGQLDQNWLQQYEKDDEWVVIPAHPLQAGNLLKKDTVKKLLFEGTIEYLGPIGPKFTATSSFRTVYSRNSNYMFKFSVPIKITNSRRVNQQKELDRGVEVSRLLNTEVGNQLANHFPHFQIIRDPACLSVEIPGEDHRLDVIVRENPFYENDANAILVAGLSQDHPYQKQTRLYHIINRIAVMEGKSTQQVSEEWFSRYLSVTLSPLLWLYEEYGIALEAHQQNSIIQLKDGYPDKFYYRDNQGYYFCESKADKLRELLPGINRKSDTICSDETAVERLRYYFFFNHLFGLINGFGVSGLISEEQLIQQLRERLEEHEKQSKAKNPLLTSLLKQEKLPCKANLLTRFHDMDELVGSLETQSVYTMVKNPLAQKVAVKNES